jgi:glycerol uptake facilitator-like aquaporin
LCLATGGSGTAIDRTGGLGANGLQLPSITVGNALVVEIMGTALLVFTVLESAVNSKAITSGTSKMSLAPIPIGLAVFVAHIVLIPVTGCSINPTRSFGPAVVSGYFDDHWIWWVGPLLGATVASLLWGLFKIIEGPAVDAETVDSKVKVDV